MNRQRHGVVFVAIVVVDAVGIGVDRGGEHEFGAAGAVDHVGEFAEEAVGLPALAEHMDVVRKPRFPIADEEPARMTVGVFALVVTRTICLARTQAERVQQLHPKCAVDAPALPRRHGFRQQECAQHRQAVGQRQEVGAREIVRPGFDAAVAALPGATEQHAPERERAFGADGRRTYFDLTAVGRDQRTAACAPIGLRIGRGVARDQSRMRITELRQPRMDRVDAEEFVPAVVGYVVADRERALHPRRKVSCSGSSSGHSPVSGGADSRIDACSSSPCCDSRSAVSSAIGSLATLAGENQRRGARP